MLDDSGFRNALLQVAPQLPDEDDDGGPVEHQDVLGEVVMACIPS